MGYEHRHLPRALTILTYTYVGLPLIIFFIGWLKIGWAILFTVLALASFVFAFRIQYENEEADGESFRPKWTDWKKILLILAIIVCWVTLSGVGGYVWQNTDLITRNGMFQELVEVEWPCMREVSDPTAVGNRAFIYYIGFWLPAALFGKWFGFEAGNVFLFIWATLGIAIFYALICVWRKKISVWPLLMGICFSGLDLVGTLFRYGLGGDEWQGVYHMEWWMKPFQYSSMTTQLFWVFNQALPAWILVVFIILYAKPKNVLFPWVCMLLSSSFPALGMLPFVVYVMFSRGYWGYRKNTYPAALKSVLHNWVSIPNTVGVLSVSLVLVTYLSENGSLSHSIAMMSWFSHQRWFLIVFFVLLLPLVGALAALFVWLYRFGYGKYMGWAAYLAVACLLVTHIGNLDQKDWTSPVFSFFELCLFLLVEVGIYLFLIFAADERFKKNPLENRLFQITAITLMICPLFVIGYASDFCMRVSIPGLMVIYLWCIRIFDDKIERNNEFNLMVNQPTAAHAYKLRNRKANILAWILVAALAIGAVTPIHEIVRTYYYSRGEYEITIGSPEGLYGQDNFSGYSIGIFWDYFAKEPKEMDPITVSLPDPLSYYTSTSK